jgi:site-specific recombinase XerD
MDPATTRRARDTVPATGTSSALGIAQSAAGMIHSGSEGTRLALTIGTTGTSSKRYTTTAMLYSEHADAFCLMQTSPRTQSEYRKDLARWFASGFPLTVDGVAQYRDYLTRSFKPASAARFFTTTRTFYRWLVKRGIIQENPFDFVKGPKRTTDEVTRVPSDADVDALLRATKTSRERAVVSLLLNGLRASEVTNLRADAVQFAPEYGHFMVVRGKGDKERIVPLLSETVADLAEFDKDNGVPSDWLVHNPDGAKLTYDMVNGIVDMAARKAKVDIYPHMLRHHYGTRLVRAGANVFAVQKLLGHASVATTQRYVTMDLSDLVEATRKDPRELGGLRVVPSNLEEGTTAGEDGSHRSAVRVASA